MKIIKLKERTLSKVNWAVNVYNEWCEARLQDQHIECIFGMNLSDLKSLEKEQLEEALCCFIPEVTKLKGYGMYPGHTLYQMCVAIQKYLNINGLKSKIVDGIDFQQLRVVLDNVMKERAQLKVGNVLKRADLIMYETEEILWQCGILGEHILDILCHTVLYLLGVNLPLCAGDEHYNLW